MWPIIALFFFYLHLAPKNVDYNIPANEVETISISPIKEESTLETQEQLSDTAPLNTESLVIKNKEDNSKTARKLELVSENLSEPGFLQAMNPSDSELPDNHSASADPTLQELPQPSDEPELHNTPPASSTPEPKALCPDYKKPKPGMFAPDVCRVVAY